jgi:hypothetical protein
MVETKPQNDTQKSRIDAIFAEIKAFEELCSKHRDYGARDSEPDGVFQRLVDAAVQGKGPAVPRTGEGWDLYAHSMDCAVPAEEMHDQALKVVRLIEECPIRELTQLKSRLRDYCWRLY